MQTLTVHRGCSLAIEFTLVVYSLLLCIGLSALQNVLECTSDGFEHYQALFKGMEDALNTAMFVGWSEYMRNC